jgi:hypothetical protein
MIGAQFLSIGILGEMFTAYLIRDTDTYSVAEFTSPLPTSKDAASPTSNVP